MIALTVDECNKIVFKSTREENVKILSFVASHFGDFLGFLGEYYRLRITACVNGFNRDFEYFVKSLPIKDLRGRREMLIDSGIFRKEAKIYENLLSEFVKLSDEIWCPKTYLIRDDLIVFEDLTLEGYKMIRDVDFEPDNVKSTLKSLANLHAASLKFESNRKMSIGCEFKEILFETSIKDLPWFHSGLKTIDILADKSRVCENFYTILFDAVKTMELSPFNIPYVLCHRDSWRNNLMFKNHHCILIDFQTARYVPLSIDVNMAIIILTRRKHYEEFFEIYLNFYYEIMKEKMINKFSIEDLRKSCEYHRKIIILYKAIVVMLTQPPQELFDDFIESDYVRFAQEDRYKYVIEFMEKDEFYRECINDAVEAVVDEFYR